MGSQPKAQLAVRHRSQYRSQFVALGPQICSPIGARWVQLLLARDYPDCLRCGASEAPSNRNNRVGAPHPCSMEPISLDLAP